MNTPGASRIRVTPLVFALTGLSACGWQSGEVVQLPNGGHLTTRHGTAIIDACPYDTTQLAALQSAAMHAVVHDVVLLCTFVDQMGVVHPSDGNEQTTLQQEVSQIQGLGYNVSLGFSLGTTPSQLVDATTGSSYVDDPTWRANSVANLANYPVHGNGIDVALQAQLLDNSRSAFTSFIADLSSHVRSAGTLAVFALPVTTSPSDIPGGDAIDLAAVGPLIDRVRLMSIDRSCCGSTSGPSTDPGWITEVYNHATQTIGSAVAVDVTVSLFGNNFTMSPMSPTSLDYGAAQDLATRNSVTPTRDVSGVLHFDYAAGSVWFDDAQSIHRYLSVLEPPDLPASVGVAYYGLGAEDPALWTTIAGAEQ